MKPKCSLPCSQQPATFPYPETDQGSPRPPILILMIHLILPIYLCLGLQSGLFPSDFPTKVLQAPLLSPISDKTPAHSLTLIPRIILKELLQHNYITSGLRLQCLGRLQSVRIVYKTIPQHITSPAPLQESSQRVILLNITMKYHTTLVFHKIR